MARKKFFLEFVLLVGFSLVSASLWGQAGGVVYVANCGGPPGGCGGVGPGNVSAYTIDGTTGALTPVGSFAADTNPTSVTTDPTGRFAYVANALSGNVSAYTIDGSTGALTPVGSFAAGTGPEW